MAAHTDPSRLIASTQSRSPNGADVGTLPTRRWYRLHVSAYVVLFLTLSFFTLINAPGNVRCCVESIDGYFQFRECIDHGWPITFLRRWPRTDDPTASYGSRRSSLWNFYESDREFFSSRALATDTFIAISLVFLSGAVAEWRRRRHRNHWQFGMAQILWTMLGLSIFFAYLVWNHEEYRAEARLEEEIKSHERDGYGYGSWQRFAVTREPRGWSWLEQLVGAKQIPIFDRVAEAQGVPPDSLDLLSQWRYARKLTVFVPLDVQSELQLHKLRRLEALEIDFQAPRATQSQAATIEEYQQRISAVLESLVRLPALRFLKIESDIPFGTSLEALAGMSNLEVVKLFGFEMTNEDLTHLPRLDSVKELYLTSDKVTNTGVTFVARLSGLRKLALASEQIDDGGLEAIASLEELRELWLAGTTVKGPGLASLRQLRHLEVVGLNPRCADIDEAAKILPGVQAYNQ